MLWQFITAVGTFLDLSLNSYNGEPTADQVWKILKYLLTKFQLAIAYEDMVRLLQRVLKGPDYLPVLG